MSTQDARTKDVEKKVLGRTQAAAKLADPKLLFHGREVEFYDDGSMRIKNTELRAAITKHVKKKALQCLHPAILTVPVSAARSGKQREDDGMQVNFRC